MPVSEATYQRIVLEDTDRIWEMDCGRLREKPPMKAEHDDSGPTPAMQRITPSGA